MIKVIEDSEVDDMIIKDNYILIMCKKISTSVIKQIGKKSNRVGIYCRDGHIIDTFNGVITEIDRKVNFTYELKLYMFQSKQLLGLEDYDVFYDFIKMKNYFKEYYNIVLYWDESKRKCIFDKTTPLDFCGGSSLDCAFKKIRQINVNAEIFKKIKFVPNLEETLNSFVDETRQGEYYRD